MILHSFPINNTFSYFDPFQATSPLSLSGSNKYPDFKANFNSSFYRSSSQGGENSFNSSTNTDSSLSDDSKEERSTPQKSKYQLSLERRHRNFEVKKKTELCKTFIMGYECPYGNKCSFAHGYEELRDKLLVSSRYKTTLCNQFHENSFCNYGPRCQFLHKAANRTPPSNIKIEYQNILEGILLCYDYQTRNNGDNEVRDMVDFLDNKVNLEKFNLKPLEIFRLCLEGDE